MFQSIITFLNLKEEEILDISVESLNGDLIVFLSLKPKLHTCPNCGTQTSRVKDYHVRTFNHGIFNDRKCIVHYKQRRYFCKICNSAFNEFCALVAPQQKKSLSSHIQIMELTKDPHLTFSMIGKLLNLSHTSVINHFYHNIPVFNPLLPSVLCIDEFYLGRKSTKKYATHLLDFIENKTIDIIYGRTKADFHSYLQKIPLNQRLNVKFISSDMFEGFRFLQTTYFPKAKLCVDSFHVIKLINDNFNTILKSFLKLFVKGSDQYYLLKKKRYLLLNNSSSVDWSKIFYDHHFNYHIPNFDLKQRLFNIDPLIKEIYLLKEEYISFNRLTDPALIPERLDMLIFSFKSHSSKEIKNIARTLLRWRAEIINSFTWINGRRISNGSIESRNSTIKLLIRNSAGYRNFEHLRLRSIYVINASKKGR